MQTNHDADRDDEYDYRIMNEEDEDDTALHRSGERLNELPLSQSPGCQSSELTPSKDCLTPTDELQSEVP